MHSQLVAVTPIKAPLMLTATSEISIALPAVCSLQAIHDEEEEEEDANDEDEQLRGAKNLEDLLVPASQVRLNRRQHSLPFEGRPFSAWWQCREMASLAGPPAF